MAVSPDVPRLVAVGFFAQLGNIDRRIFFLDAIGGAAAAPIAAWVTSRVPQHAATAAVGVIVFVLGAAGLFVTLG